MHKSLQLQPTLHNTDFVTQSYVARMIWKHAWQHKILLWITRCSASETLVPSYCHFHHTVTPIEQQSLLLQENTLLAKE